MEPETLSPKAKKIINDYINLPFEGVSGVRCPYFNNLSIGRRGQLRVLIGKGTPREIVDETKIIAIQYKSGIFEPGGGFSPILANATNEEKIGTIRKFLIDNSIGVDCSGFASHILGAHILETKQIDILPQLALLGATNFFRRMIVKMRPVENIGVRSFADDRMSAPIPDISSAKAGDYIIMIKTGPRKNRNHIIVITENNNGTFKYIHARAWDSEGQYRHGVSEGIIKITRPGEGLLQQEWVEKNRIAQNNETYLEARWAEKLELRRLKI
jgi:hypothetical protein